MLETICDTMNHAYQRGWITSRDGNVSIRHHDRNHFYITPSGVRKQTLQPDQFKKIEILKQRVENRPLPFAYNWQEMEYTDISKNLRPSGEILLHFGLQREIHQDEVRVVMHFHPTYTVAAMHAGIELQDLTLDFPELSRYTSVAPNVPDVPPISQQLADYTIDRLDVCPITGLVKYDIIGIKGHGVVAVDTTPWRCFEHIERLEHICQIVLASGRH